MKWVPVRSGEALLSLEIQPLKEEEQLHNNLSYLPVSIREKECAFFTSPGVRVGMFHLAPAQGNAGSRYDCLYPT